MFQVYIFDVNGLGPGGSGRSCVIDPSGTNLYQAAGQEEIIPVEVDMDLVRRQRATGLRGLGQTLKSFRDRDAYFGIYDPTCADNRYLYSLGPLEMPHQGSQDGIGVLPPVDVIGQTDPAAVPHVEEHHVAELAKVKSAKDA